LEARFFRRTNVSATAHLLFQLVKRDISIRFTGSALGLAWAVLQPLTLVILYWFVFSIILSRSTGPGGDYMYVLLAGLLPWLAFNEGVVRSTTSIVDNSAIVRRLSLKSEVLVAVPHISAIFFEIIALTIFAAILAVSGHALWGLWVLPFAIVMQFLLQMGAGLFLSAIHVFFRDVVQLLGFVLSIGFYLSPILYDVPPRFAAAFAWNPLTPLFGLFRTALLGQALPPVGSIVFLVTVALGLFSSGLWFFRRAQPTLVDLI
jgi:lipopolysaccharide transport system permease protein